AEETAIFTLAGPHALNKLLVVGCSANPAPGRALTWEYRGEEITVLGNLRPLSMESMPTLQKGKPDPWDEVFEYTLLVPARAAPHLWDTLAKMDGVTFAGEEEWQFLRIRQGIPFPGKELTNDYNPLQAGLWHAVHFDKGCYIGQETISRVNAFNAVRTQLFGVVFDDDS
ncbi:unnamed protein product, partial [Discosporangium mesarthrocarpum]